jgi:hypothetical protein
METNTASNLVDITDLSDAALDVFLDVKAGADCVTVEHLTDDERRAVCAALGVTAPGYWIRAASYAAPVKAARPGRDYENAILTRQDRTFND